MATQLFGDRRVPPFGGFSLVFLAIETRRLLRNRRTVILTLVAPVALFFLFRDRPKLSFGGADAAAATLIGLAVYGAMLAATSGGAMVSIERALGWSRQLRLTPLSSIAYIAIKLMVAMLLGLASVLIVYIAGAIDSVKMEPEIWLLTGLLAWLSAFVFAALGLFMGYLLPSQNVMQVIGPILGVFSLLGGLFVPVSLLPTSLQNVAPYTPPYGVVGIARYPLLGGTFDWTWVLSVVLWTAAFSVAAAFLFRRDTGRT